MKSCSPCLNIILLFACTIFFPYSRVSVFMFQKIVILFLVSKCSIVSYVVSYRIGKVSIYSPLGHSPSPYRLTPIFPPFCPFTPNVLDPYCFQCRSRSSILSQMRIRILIQGAKPVRIHAGAWSDFKGPKLNFCVKIILKVNVENPGSGNFLTLGSGMSFFRIPDPERIVTIFG